MCRLGQRDRAPVLTFFVRLVRRLDNLVAIRFLDLAVAAWALLIGVVAAVRPILDDTLHGPAKQVCQAHDHVELRVFPEISQMGRVVTQHHSKIAP